MGGEAGTSWQDEVRKALKNAESGVLSRWNACDAVLQQHGMAYTTRASPKAFLVHPANRGSLGVNAFGMHRKGAQILHMGVDPTQLRRSTAWELRHEPDHKARQVAFTENLALSCDGLLAAPTGVERFLTTSSSHTTQFFKALLAGCRTPESSLADEHGRLSGKWLQSDAKLKSLLEDGWDWTIYRQEVEACFPELPDLCQKALNASNTTYACAGELEAALAVASAASKLVAAGSAVDFDKLGKAITAETPLAPMGTSIAHFVQHFGGGEGAPLVKFLDVVSKEYGDNVALGSEFWDALAHTQLQSAETTFPLLRVAVAVTNLCCAPDRVVDGVARHLSKKDVEKLKSTSLKTQVADAEAMLMRLWQKAQTATTTHVQTCRVFGRACLRVVALLLQRKGRENRIFDSLSAIEEQYQADASRTPTQQAQGGDGAASAQPVLGFVSTEQASDRLFLAQQRMVLQSGRRYTHKEHAEKEFELKYMDDSNAYFQHEDLLGSDSMELSVPLADVPKNMKLCKGERAQLLSPAEFAGRLDETVADLVLSQAQVLRKLAQAATDWQPEAGDLLLEYPAKKLYAAADYKKEELWLVPTTDAIGKIVVKEPKAEHARAEYNFVQYFILPPKGLRKQEDGTWSGSSSPFWHVGKAEDGCMVRKFYEYDGVVMSCLTNKRAVKKHEVLMEGIKPEAKKPEAKGGAKRKR
jgi:hypothetical protein